MLNETGAFAYSTYVLCIATSVQCSPSTKPPLVGTNSGISPRPVSIYFGSMATARGIPCQGHRSLSSAFPLYGGSHNTELKD